MKKKLAIFEYTSGVLLGFQFPTESHMENSDEAVRISEYVEIEFPDIPRDELISRQIKAIDKEIEYARVNHTANIARLEQRKAELLALTCETEAQP